MRFSLPLAVCSLAPFWISADIDLDKEFELDQVQTAPAKKRPSYSSAEKKRRAAEQEAKAASKNSLKESNEQIAEADETPSEEMQLAQEKRSESPASELTPNLMPEKGVMLGVDYLCLTAREDGLEYATRGVLINTSSTAPIERGSASALDPSWRSGFRLAAGYALPKHEWDMTLKWTWYRNKSHDSVSNGDSSSNGTLLTPIWDQPIAGFAVSIAQANAAWRLHYNTLDFEMGRKCSIGSYFTLRPYLGIRGAWIKQQFDLSYRDFSNNLLTVDNKNYFEGVGFRPGVDGRFYFNSHWSILGKASAALVWGKFHVVQKQQSNHGAISQPFVNVVDNFHSIKLAMEMALGLSFETTFSNDRYKLEANFLWEYFDWINQNQMLRWTRYEMRPQRGDLSLQGLSVALIFRF